VARIAPRRSDERGPSGSCIPVFFWNNFRLLGIALVSRRHDLHTILIEDIEDMLM
jgi:hypothetical protein